MFCGEENYCHWFCHLKLIKRKQYISSSEHTTRKDTHRMPVPVHPSCDCSWIGWSETEPAKTDDKSQMGGFRTKHTDIGRRPRWTRGSRSESYCRRRTNQKKKCKKTTHTSSSSSTFWPAQQKKRVNLCTFYHHSHGDNKYEMIKYKLRQNAWRKTLFANLWRERPGIRGQTFAYLPFSSFILLYLLMYLTLIRRQVLRFVLLCTQWNKKSSLFFFVGGMEIVDGIL